VLAALVLAGAYLLGSIPFSFLVARGFGVADVRQVGSGNVGATNVMRSAGKAAGITAFVLDFAKGLSATLLALRFGPTALAGPAAVAAVLGHMYPPWLRFRGGKGVSTGAGAFFPLAPTATATAVVAFVAVAAATRYVSVGSVAAAVTLGLAAFVSGVPASVSRAAVFVALLVVWKHRGNLERIVKGTESRVGRPRPGAPAR
jgi:acyl phosphate:glycerol-3-phosphate acyltransferase